MEKMRTNETLSQNSTRRSISFRALVTWWKRATVWLGLLGLTLSVPVAFGADSTTNHTKISWSGLVDVYYSYNFNNPSNQMNRLRNFDIYENQFGFSLAKLTVQEQARPVGFRVDFALGPTNDVVQGIPPYGVNAYSTLSNLEQAYLTGVVPVGNGLTVDVGKFVTMMGNEVIEPNANWNYSRSLLFAYSIPYFHTGIRLTYPFSSRFTGILEVTNGWNNVVAINKSKTVGLSLSYSPTPSTSLTLNGMTGFEQPLGNEYGKRDVAEIIITQQVNSSLSLAVDAVYGRDRVSGSLVSWKGVAIYGKYNFCSNSDLAIRGEVYYDPEGYTTGAAFPKATFKEITLTYEYDPVSFLILRLEGRDDFANGPEFVGANSAAPTKTSQPTLLLGAITTF